VLEKRMLGNTLTPAEFQMFEDLPQLTQSLIGHIPRLEPIIKIIKTAFSGGVQAVISMNDETALAAAILRAVIRLDQLLDKGFGRNEAISNMQMSSEQYNPAVLDQLRIVRHEQAGVHKRRLSIDQLRVGMVLNEPIRTEDGLTVAPAGFRVNDLIRQLLKNLKLQNAIPEFVEVIIEDKVE
jgi:hypothetical protein